MGRAFCKALIVPILVLALFLVAPHWLNQHIRESIRKSLEARQTLTPQASARLAKMDFVRVCFDPQPGEEELKANFERAGVAGQARRLWWSLEASWLLLGILVGTGAAIWFLNQRGKRSAADFMRSYYWGWRLAIFAALAQLFLLTPLMAYGCFEATVLLSNSYYPKMIIVIVLAGVVGIVRGVQILCRSLPLEFTEAMARDVTPEQAPALWSATRAAAAQLGTAPPDHIVIGMQLNFYVTELAVKHGTGRTTGRTLYLSYPTLKQLTSAEVLAIIGHELGHFIGEDTRMTREFYPLRLKVHGTMVALTQATFVGWTSLQLMNFFAWCFGVTERALSRQRELLADQWAARLTSAATSARALVKFQVLAGAFQHGLNSAVRESGGNPLDLQLQKYVAEHFPAESPFWGQLFEKTMPHPLDTHPPLRERLAALGAEYTAAEVREVAISEAASAYDEWLNGHDELFTPLRQEAAAVVDHVRLQNQVRAVDYQTPEGRRLLEERFPEVRWVSRPGRLRLELGVAVVAVVTMLVVAVAIGNAAAWAVAAVVFALAGWVGGISWKLHRGGSCNLTAGGLHHTGWVGPVDFKEIEVMKFLNSSGSLSVVLRFKQRRGPLWKYSLWRIPRRQWSFSLSCLTGKQPEIAQTIFNYFTRQIKVPAQVAAVAAGEEGE